MIEIKDKLDASIAKVVMIVVFIGLIGGIVGISISIFQLATGQMPQEVLLGLSPLFWYITFSAAILMISIAGIAVWFGFRDYLSKKKGVS